MNRKLFDPHTIHATRLPLNEQKFSALLQQQFIIISVILPRNQNYTRHKRGKENTLSKLNMVGAV